MQNTWRAVAVIVAAVLVAFSGSNLLGTTVVVGTCVSGLPSFSTIQDAVDAASPGSLIQVCPGLYPEQVVISRSLTLQGVQSGAAHAAVIVPPTGGMVANSTSLNTGDPIAAQVLIQNATNVNMDHITVDGTGNGITACSPGLVGIFYQNASGTISLVSVRNQKLASGLEGCQSGLGIFVQSGGNGSSTVTVRNSSVHDYQKAGITGNETGTQVTIRANTIAGQGPTTGAAEDGIQIGFGATGAITDNFVIDDIFVPAAGSGPPTTGGSGILVYASTGVTISSNVVGGTQFGIAAITDPLAGPADQTVITRNTVFATRDFDGIDVCSNKNTVQLNSVSNSTRSGIHLDSTCGSTGNGNTVTFNTIAEACAGILEGNGKSDNIVAHNPFANVTQTFVTGDTCSDASLSASSSGSAHFATRPRVGNAAKSPVRP